MLRTQAFGRLVGTPVLRRGVTAASAMTPACASAVLFNTARFASSDASQQRIYKSTLPSVMDRVNTEPTMYHYMRRCLEAADPNKIALIQAETGQKLTYSELMQATKLVASMLYHIGGIRKGDVVCVAMLNSILYGPICYGTMRVGGVVSSVNVVAAPQTLAYHFKTNQCKVVLGMKFFQTAIEAAVNIAERELGRKIPVFYPEDFMKTPPAELAKQKVPEGYDPLADATLDDTVFIPFSSGTTGLPKGVQLTSRNLIANMEQGRDILSATADEVSISVLPFFHIYGFTCCLNTPLAVGATQVVMMKYTVDSFLDVIEKYKATMASVAPPILVSLIKSKEKVLAKDVSSLNCVRSGSAPLSAELEKACEKLFPNASVGQGYGMTEMSPVVSSVPRRDMGSDRIYGSGGVLAADTELRIVKVDDSQQSGADKSAGVDCAPGEPGEIWLRGPQMMKGYMHQEDTDKTMQDGWYRSGDIGWFDERTQQLTVTDRLKELIKYKGFQVSPASMEAMLLQHPWVHDCIVVGVPDPRDVSFENPRALVVLKPGLPASSAVEASDVIYRYVMRHSPPHKRLHGGVRVVDVIPRNEAGKVLRRQIRSDEIALVKKATEAEEEAEAAAAKVASSG